MGRLFQLTALKAPLSCSVISVSSIKSEVTKQWHEPSKLRASLLVEKLLVSSLPLKLPGSLLQPQEVSRNPTGTGLGLWHSERLEGTRSPRSCSSGNCHSSAS